MSVTVKALINSKFASATSTTEYTVPSNTKTIIDKFTATNTDASARTLSVYFVPSGGAAGSSNLIINAMNIPIGEAVDISQLKSHILNAGDFIVISASAGATIVVRASGREVL